MVRDVRLAQGLGAWTVGSLSWLPPVLGTVSLADGSEGTLAMGAQNLGLAGETDAGVFAAWERLDGGVSGCVLAGPACARALKLDLPPPFRAPQPAYQGGRYLGLAVLGADGGAFAQRLCVP